MLKFPLFILFPFLLPILKDKKILFSGKIFKNAAKPVCTKC